MMHIHKVRPTLVEANPARELGNQDVSIECSVGPKEALHLFLVGSKYVLAAML